MAQTARITLDHDIDWSHDKLDSRAFGMDLLGFRWNNDPAFAITGAVGASFVRWPGGIIADALTAAWSEANFDLSEPGVLDKGGSSRDDLQDVLADCAAQDLGFVMLAPSERFVSYNAARGVFDLDLAAARASVSDFVLSLARGDRFGTGVDYEIPEDFIIQLHQEYYGVFFPQDHVDTPWEAERLWTKFVTAMATVWREMAVAIKEAVATVHANPGDYVHSDIDIKVATNIGRFQTAKDFGAEWRWSAGSVEDIDTMTDAFGRKGLEAIDILLWQRYMPTTDGIDQGFTRAGGTGYTLDDAVRDWEKAAWDAGLRGKSYETMVGASIANMTRDEARIAWTAAGNRVSDRDFDFSRRGDRDFETFYQREIDKGPFGYDLPPAIIDLFAEFSAAGVDIATSYSADLIAPHHQGGRLTAMDRDGTMQVLAGGQIYGRLAETLPGKRVMDGAGEVVTGDDAVNLNAFRGDGEVVIYANATRLTKGAITAEIDLGGLPVSIGDLSVTILTPYVIDDWQAKFGIVDLGQRWQGFNQGPEAAIYSRLSESAGWARMGENGALSVDLDRSWQIAEIRIDLGAEGTDGNDRFLIGTRGGEAISGRGGDDRIWGRGGDDRLSGDAGADILHGDHGQDTLDGGTGQDELHGGEGWDRLFGGDGGDVLHGGAENDRLEGGDGDDRLHGGWGDDRLFGGEGADRLAGGPGEDILHGGQGADVFVFDGRSGTTRIEDFAAEDRIEIDGARGSVELTLLSSAGDRAGTEVRLEIGGGHLEIVTLLDPAEVLDAFVFV